MWGVPDHERGIECAPCSAHFPVPVFHPANRPCITPFSSTTSVPLPRVGKCFCQPGQQAYAGCPVHGEFRV